MSHKILPKKGTLWSLGVNVCCRECSSNVTLLPATQRPLCNDERQGGVAVPGTSSSCIAGDGLRGKGGVGGLGGWLPNILGLKRRWKINMDLRKVWFLLEKNVPSSFFFLH